MSPRRPVLPGPTSAERSGLDTGRGRDGREKDPGDEGEAGEGPSAPTSFLALQGPLDHFSALLDRGLDSGWEEDGRHPSV